MTPKTFSERLKEARLAAGMSQSALARRAGLTGSYISLLESRRRPPPTPRVIRALSRALGIDSVPLVEAAALERSPPTVRRRFERMRKERGRVHQSRDRLLTTTLFHLSRRPRVVEPMAEFLDLPAGQQALLGRLLGRVRKVKSLREAETRSATILEEATPEDRDALVRVLPGALTGDEESEGKAAQAEDEHLSAHLVPIRRDPRPGRSAVEDNRVVDAPRWRPGLFFWRMDGDGAYPHIESGDLLLIDPSREAAEGDLVLVEHAGHVTAGTLGLRSGSARIEFPRPDVPPLRIKLTRFAPLGVVVEIRRELTT